MKSRIIGIFWLFTAVFIAPATAVNKLFRGECLTVNQQLTSTSGCFIFIFQTDGNAVVYRVGANSALTAVYSTQTGGTSSDRICMQTDGNLVVYAGPTPYFNTGTYQTAADHVTIQDDGNLVVYNAGESQVFWASNSAQSGVTCPAPTTTQATTTPEAFTLPETTVRPGCDFSRLLFDQGGQFLKLACWVRGPRDQAGAVEYCSDFGMRLFVPTSAEDMSALATTTISVFGRGGFTSIWISGTRRIETPWRDSNSGGQQLFTAFTPAIVDFAGYNPGKCLSLASFGVDGYQIVSYDCYTAQSFWCEF